jgi:lipopolysaccharide export LptBFGC system permease protein LptF
MTLPGGRLRMIASRLCTAQTMERVIDPLIADLQMEYGQASHAGDMWKARSVWLLACLALLKVIVLCGGRSRLSLEGEPADERRAMIRVIALSAASICAATVLFVTPFWRTVRSGVHAQQFRLLLSVIPQAIPVAIPIGLTIGILFGFRGRLISMQSRRLVFAMAVALSLVSFTNLSWLMPVANQSFRESVAAAARGVTRVRLAKGPNEMTLAELSGEIDYYRNTFNGKAQIRSLEYSYYQRWSLACANAVLALFAIAVTARRSSGKWTVGLIAVGVPFAYYVLLFLGRSAAVAGTISAFVGAWFPNMVFILGSVLLLKIASGRSGELRRAAPAPELPR